MTVPHVNAHDLLKLGLAAAVEQRLEGFLVDELVAVLLAASLGLELGRHVDAYLGCVFAVNVKEVVELFG